MDFINIDWSFLNDRVWGLRWSVWLLVIGFILAGILLRNVITLLFTKVFYRIFKSWFGSYPAEQFRKMFTRPVRGLIQWILFYYAFVQIEFKLQKIKIFKSFAKITDEIQSETIKGTSKLTLGELMQGIISLAFVFYGTMLIAKLIEYYLSIKLKKAENVRDRSKQQMFPLMRDISRVVLWAIAIAVSLGLLFDIKMGTIIGGVGLGGVALAFAAKESLENLIASFMVLVDKPFTIGDWIKVDGIDGIIERVGFRSSRIRTFDKSVVIIPNRKLIDSKVENYSSRGTRRFKFTIGAIYGISQANLEKAMEEIKQQVSQVPGITDEVVMWLDGFGDSQLNLEIYFFLIVNDDYKFWDIRHKVNFIIYNIMYKYCKGFAFPTQTEIPGEDINEVSQNEIENMPKSNNANTNSKDNTKDYKASN